MPNEPLDERRQAHQLIDRLEAGQLHLARGAQDVARLHGAIDHADPGVAKLEE